MACYYIVISSTHLSNGHFRNIKGVFRGPLSKNGNNNLDYAEKEKSMAKALEGLKANFYCELCDKQYYKHQEFDNHINSYDHAHTQRLKELKQREFARNVASKTRKDERKQERALRRLHQLAEQRREVQCAPGSGPKFKSTTVAVEGSFRETCSEGSSEETQSSTLLDTGNQNHTTTTTTTGSSSNHNSKQTMWPYTGKAKKQTYRRKIGFSFSFPKKASLKLESSAAVFCESIEEGSKSWRGKQKHQLPLIELNIPPTPAAKKGLCGDAIITPHDEFSPDSVSTGGQGLSEKPAGPDTMPPVSDLCTLLVYSENIASPYVSQTPTSPCHTNYNNTVAVTDSQKLEETLENNLTESKTETSKHTPKVEGGVSGGGNQSIITSSLEVVPDIPPESDSSSSSSSLSPTREDDVTVKPLCPFTKPSQPFFSVLSRDGSTVLQWPSEMLTCTRTQPCLSYSCNPLHFDFKASQARVKGSDTQNKTEPIFAEESCISTENPIDVDKHNKQPCSGLDHSPNEDEETVERKDCHICEHYMSDTESFLRTQRHRGYSTRCRHSKVRTHSGKRAAEKWKSRDRRHYRSHKKKRKRRRRRRRGGGEERHRDTDGGESDVEKCNKFQRWPECWEGHDNQFRGTTSQKVQPLEKSKQSAMNQPDDGYMAPLAERGGSGRQEPAGGISGPAGSGRLSDEGATDAEKVFRSSGREPEDPSTEQRNTTGHGSNRRCNNPCPESVGTVTKNPDETTPCTPERCTDSSSQSRPSGRKRAAASLVEGGDGDQGRSCTRCRSSTTEPTGLGSALEEERPGWPGCASCEEGRQRKRQRGSRYTAQTSYISPEILTDGDSCKLSTQSENFVTTTVECLVLKDPLNSSCALSHPVLADRKCSAPPIDNTPSMKYCSLSQPVPVRNPTEIVFAMNESKDSTVSPTIAKYTVEMDSGKVCSRPTVAAHISPPGERESSSQMQKASLDKSCQHSPQSQHPRGHPGVRDQDERGVRENLIPGPYHQQPSPYHRPASPFHRHCFQPPPESMEKHCLLQIQTHRHVLHQQVFPGKMKPVHPGSHVSVAPPAMLHPIHHLPSPMPSGSITIRHTILQHHTAFLPPQPTLFRHQILPVSGLPMGAEICPPGPPPPFAAPPQLSVVAPPPLHPMAVTFHTLPRPAMYPSMMRPHPTVIPLQPMF